MARTRRRYVLLRRDLVLEVSTIEVRVVNSQVVPAPRERAIRVRAGNVRLRLVLDTSLQFAKWNDALQTAALWELSRFYAVVPGEAYLSRGRFSTTRSATVLPSRLRVGPCPAVYTPRLDHVFAPSATHAALADEATAKLRTSTSEHGTLGSTVWESNTNVDDEDDASMAGTIDTDLEPISNAQITSVMPVHSGFGEFSAREAAPDSAGPTRARALNRKSFGSFRMAAAASRSTNRGVAGRFGRGNVRLMRGGGGGGTFPKLRKNTRIQHEPAADNHHEHLAEPNYPGVVPDSYNAAQLLRIQTGFSPALRASLEGSEYRGSTKVVVKSVSREGFGKAEAASDALVAHAHLRHHGLTHILDVFETPDVVHTVFEWIDGPTLVQKGVLGEAEAARTCRTLLKAVGYLHACGICHFDIRPESVILVDGDPSQPKLRNFGNARHIDPYTGVEQIDDAVLSAGSRQIWDMECASPEVLAAKAHQYAPKTDMWQVGCVLYYMIVGKNPFERFVLGDDEKRDSVVSADAAGQNRFQRAVKRAIFEFCKLRSSSRIHYLFNEKFCDGIVVSDNARALIAQLLTPNPRMRPNALLCLQRAPFLQGLG